MASIIVPSHVSVVEDAEALRKAVQGWGTDEKAIILLLGHRNSAQRKQIRIAYEEIYQEDLVKRLESELSGDFERAIYRWVLEPADRDAVLCHVAIRKHEPDYHVLVEISCIRSPEELIAIRRAYQIRYKCSLEEDVAAHTSGDIRKLLVALLTAFRYIYGAETHGRLANSEAEILRDAIIDKEYNHEEVIRIVSTRSKLQLLATFNRYREEHGTSITKELLDDSDNEFAMVLYITIRCLVDPKKYFEKVLRNSIKKLGTDEDALTRVIVTRAEVDLQDIKELYYKKNSELLEHAVAKDTSGDYKHFLLTLLGKED
ncbi:annexin-like protein RJ4 [Carica papaya]|uniref:annexin-like protein RJ4 n=1 Tax=Carica papaya TaxID=3649 RepID=UPI000B8CA5D5|nr:annexin-like protein RJ4 [Carica papaya]XP_021911165.1 annexin-like protein RJ4 [Carica papaya]